MENAMNSQKPVWKSVLKTLSLHQGVMAAIVAIPLLAAPAFSWAKDGVLSLHGSIVNSSCSVSRSDVTTSDAHSRVLEVAPGVNMLVNTEHNACGDQAVPFVAHYQAIPVTAQTGGDARPDAVVITLSYQ
ncbi:hypothetical protein ALQ72_05374 [Pseudomonas syringae pv. maculicola]|uniref:Type 1 fimbrial protein n=2 Tax=Pseudomonas syringae group genomosp. 3 TaxID=251701 RepID=A0A0N1JJZ9_PSEYM|nr:Uncharacterized protein AC503_2515 [Pseudomonas syringae pv. maculicola]RMM74074.1 hypothetical protein ALQ72_05374 [Pseudomonas syringae pv. maculicola]RMV43186.1 hypothetical protein ALP13_02216 [Pseudomonas syringae pv. maculicola]